MSNYPIQPIDLSGLRTISLKERGGKVRLEDFANPYVKNSGVMGLLQSLPQQLPQRRPPAALQPSRKPRTRWSRDTKTSTLPHATFLPAPGLMMGKRLHRASIVDSGST